MSVLSDRVKWSRAQSRRVVIDLRLHRGHSLQLHAEGLFDVVEAIEDVKDVGRQNLSDRATFLRRAFGGRHMACEYEPRSFADQPSICDVNFTHANRAHGSSGHDGGVVQRQEQRQREGGKWKRGSGGAVRSSGDTEARPDHAAHGECDWDYDAPDNSSQLLQLNIWTEDFYKQGGELVDADAQPFAIGERKGNIKVSDLTGIDISWVEKGRFIQLAYSTVGPSVPKATTKVEEVKALAKKVSSTL
jgi:hypothetical protein